MAKHYKEAKIQSPLSSLGKCFEVTETNVEVKYKGLVFYVTRRYYEDRETGATFTTGEQDQEWWNDMKRQYYEYLSKIIPDAVYHEILDFLDPLVVVKDKFSDDDLSGKFKAFNLEISEIDSRFFESEKSHSEYMIQTTDIIGEGRTPTEAVKDLYIKLGK